MLTKFAFFDFDDTLIHGDSGGKLLKYYLKKHPLSVFKLFKVVYHYALYLLKIEPLNKAKSAWLYPLDKMSDQEIEKFYQEVLEPCYYLNVIEELKKKKATVREYTKAVYQFVQANNMQRQIDDYRIEFQNQGEISRAKEYEQVYVTIITLLDRIVELMGDEVLTIKEYKQIL